VATGEGSRSENIVVYASGLVQGIALVTFPAASSIFTTSGGYGLTASQYGAMFLPQVVLAIIASLAGGRLTARFGAKTVFLLGLSANLLSMIMLVASQFVNSDHAYPFLLVATAALGAGFGLTVPTLNTLAAAFHPASSGRAVLVLNALLGLGTALAPVFVAIFVGLGFWWGLPVLSALLLAVIGFLALRLPLTTGLPESSRHAGVPRVFWLFAAIAVAYGMVETLSGNWAGPFMTSTLRATALQASIALTAFWAFATLGRIVFAALERVLTARWIYRVTPLMVAVAYVFVSLALPSPIAGIVLFAVAGFGCSALLPLTISIGEARLTTMPAAAAGALIAFYQVGYGLAAFGVGPARDVGVDLPSVFRIAAVVAVIVSLLAFAITTQSSTTSRGIKR
jgi:fucose permease